MKTFLVEDCDVGLRSINPGKCFYCHREIGDSHGPECVTVVKLVRYEVLALGNVVGTFSRDDPAFWTPHDCEFHKNDSSWCRDNALDAIKWLDTDQARCAKDQAEVLASKEDGYTCGLLEFRYVSESPEIRRSED